MRAFEVYRMRGFCESEWELLGTVHASSPEQALQYARSNWPHVPTSEMIILSEVAQPQEVLL